MYNTRERTSMLLKRFRESKLSQVPTSMCKNGSSWKSGPLFAVVLGSPHG